MIGRREIWMEGCRYEWKEGDIDGRREIYMEGGRFGWKEGDMDGRKEITGDNNEGGR